METFKYKLKMKCGRVRSRMFLNESGQKTWKILTLTSLIVWLPSALSAENAQYPVKLTYGLYKQELDSPIYYSSFIPMIYEFNLPVWSNMDITLRDWRGKCETDEFSPSYSCPVFFHFEKFIERFKQEVLPQNMSDLSATAPVSLPEDLCNSIEPHFPGTLTAHNDLEIHIEKLRKCSFGKYGLFARSIQDYVYNIKQIYKTMNQKFEAEFSNKMSSGDRIGPAYYINALASHQNSLMFNYWVEKTRWNQAEITCNNKNIPSSLIKIANFTNGLATIEKQMSLLNLTPSVPINETSIYYKMPIADCTFINNGKFVVRILIPVRQRSKQKMYKIKPVPFIYSDGKEKKLCQIKMDPEKILYDATTGSLEKTTCKSRSLCQVVDNTESQLPDMCISSFFSESLTSVRKHCNYDCLTLNDHGPTIPIFLRVSSDTYIVTGNSIVGILVKCDYKPNLLLKHQDFGALEVRLPCNCVLMFHSESYHVQQPCTNQLVINQVMPVHFIKENRLNDIKSVETAIDLSDTNMLNTNIDPNSEKLHTVTIQEGLHSESSSPTVLWVLFTIQTLIMIALIVVGIYKYKLHRSDILYSKERLVYNITSISSPSIAENYRASSIEST